MKSRLLGLMAAVLLFGGAASAADYKAPRNALGQPDLQGVWNTHFVLPMEARPDMPSLTLSEADATAYARKLNAEAGKLAIFAQDPEVAEIRGDASRSDLAIVRGQRRTRQVVQPADGLRLLGDLRELAGPVHHGLAELGRVALELADDQHTHL